jgi:hypothetical protein
MGRGVTVAIMNGQLGLGPWLANFFKVSLMGDVARGS